MSLNRRRSYKQMQADQRERIAGHVCRERISRAFDFRTPGKGSIYAYSLTWTPGSISLAGDCGELTIVHYHALRDLQEGLHWAAGSDYDYLLSKTALRPRYDPEATIRDIVAFAGDPALHTMQRLRDELRTWRREKPRAENFETEDEPDQAFAEELAAWEGDRPEPLKFWDRDRRGAPRRAPPDGFEMWNKLRDELAGHLLEEAIFTHAGRDEIKYQLDEQITDGGRHAAIDLCQNVGLDDYYGAESWDYHDLLRITCVQEGARQALDLLEAERVYRWYMPDELAIAGQAQAA